jgi:hypothetical protein
MPARACGQSLAAAALPMAQIALKIGSVIVRTSCRPGCCASVPGRGRSRWQSRNP